jgi:hypothetical protein
MLTSNQYMDPQNELAVRTPVQSLRHYTKQTSNQIWYIGSSRKIHRGIGWPDAIKTYEDGNATENACHTQTIGCNNDENIPLRAFLLGVMAVAAMDPLFTLEAGLMNSAGTR